MMNRKSILACIGVAVSLTYIACITAPNVGRKTAQITTPDGYKSADSVVNTNKDTVNTASIQWKDFFTDSNLVSLIDTALKNNQELNILLQEINISKNEIKARKGAYLPFVGIRVGAGVEKSSKYTRNGAIDATTNITPNTLIPDPLPDLMIGAVASWQIDIWKQLRNATKSAIYKYAATIDGKNFMVTNLIAEIARSYYELLGLDNQLEILKGNIQVQENALEIVRMEKIAGRTTELAVRRFEAEVLKNRSRQFFIIQKITETENRINFLSGRLPQPVARSVPNFTNVVPNIIQAGIPSQLLENRPDIRQAAQELAAAKLDVKVTKANFYPTLTITAALGLEAFNPKYLVTAPESILWNIAGGLVAPLINRNAIKATYYSANAKQVQAVYNYERAILNAHMQVITQLSNITNLEKSYTLQTQEVDALTTSIGISIGLFKAARADYMEVLLTQRDALEAKFERVETKVKQLNAMVNVYQSLGGGWN